MNAKKKFLNVYYKIQKNIPAELNMPIVVFAGKPFSWNAVKQEIDHGTAFGNECLKKLEKLAII